MLSVPLRTLKRKFHIKTDDPSIGAALAFMKTDPEIDGEQPEHVDLPVKMNHGFLSLQPPSGRVVEGSVHQVLSELHRIHFVSTVDECPNAALIGCGAITIDDQHTIFIGEEGAGQSTLLLYLAAMGWPLAGDGQLIFDGATAIPRPRSLRVGTGTLAFLPKRAADIVRAAPFFSDWHGSPTYAVEPSAFGNRWVLRTCPVSNIILLRGNHGGRSRIRPLGRRAVLEQILKIALLPDTNKLCVLAGLRALVMSANCLELWNGRVEDSHSLLGEMFGKSVQ
jgi:hypothetical protein